MTPNRIGGPWDISRHFSRDAEGFHLKEYSIAELAAVFRKAGFRRVGVLMGARGRYLRVPAGPMIACESLAGLLPHAWRMAAAARFLTFGYIRMVAEK